MNLIRKKRMPQKDNSGYTITIDVLRATDVPQERTKNRDPYVSITYRDIKQKTSVKKNESDPTWNEKLVFDLKNTKPLERDLITIHLKDHETLKTNKILANGEIRLDSVMKYGSLKDCQIELFDPYTGDRLESTKLYIDIEYINLDEKNDTTTSNSNTSSTTNTNDSSVKNKKSNDSGFNSETSSIQSYDGLVQEASTMAHKKLRSTLAQDFQIRISIIEARQLDGDNIRAICRTKCINNIRHTKKIHSNNPQWDEIYFYNYHMAPAELFDQMIEFEIDIGYIYDEPYHSITRKWLLLTDCDNDIMGVKGYLKVSINVLGPGDEPPSTLYESGNDENIESNLLKPPGSTLQKAVLTMKLYKAEDLPRMDSDIIEGVKNFINPKESPKDLVDPYVIFSFAGNKVKSNTLYNNANPDWNQEMKLNIQFPTLCDEIGITVKDWDRATKDDVVGTIYLKTNKISDNSEFGFLPVFGPSWVPIYGSPREYSEFLTKFEKLNLGKGEGVAYRGRVLFELQTIVGELPLNKTSVVNEISNFEVQRISPLLQREMFKLNACFLSATMISMTNKPIEFEISIGNYGNKFEKDILPSPSTTSPSNTVYDGNSYHYVPWTGIKPYVQITSFWEDITFRLEASNYISNLYTLIDKLANSTMEIIKLDESEIEERHKNKIMDIIKEIIIKISVPMLQALKNQKTNTLDYHILKLRENCIERIKNLCNELMKVKINDIKNYVEEIETVLIQLDNLRDDPQNSIPDIIIWMLYGDERVAYHRIPAKDILYSKKAEGKGAFCGRIQTITMKWPGVEADDTKKNNVTPAQLRAKFWFGLEKDESEWIKAHLDESKNGAITIFAETFENEKYDIIRKSWHPAKPNFTDSTGKISLPKEDFKLPLGWVWQSDWQVVPDKGATMGKDAGHSTFNEEVYEQQSRLIPGTAWSSDSESTVYLWADYRGSKSPSKDEIKIESDWAWKDDEWSVDKGRAVDNEGWEYCVTPSREGWSPTEKIYHLIRRRRWIRTRIRTSKMKENFSISNLMILTSNAQKSDDSNIGWEYSNGLFSKYHVKEKNTDTVRRRRLFREMKPSNLNNFSATFQFYQPENEESEKTVNLTAPRLFLKFNKPNKCQLRAYIYQARSLLSGDSDTSLSDPFCQISFLTQSAKTEVINKTTSPIWDQTLIFESIDIHGEIITDPPKIFVELFDQDKYGSPDFLGNSTVVPILKGFEENDKKTELKWFRIENLNNEEAGEILVAFELFLLDNSKLKLPELPPMHGSIYRVPVGIRPELERTVIEILCWSLTKMKPFQFTDVNCPQVTFECNDSKVQSDILKNAKHNSNFTQPVLYFVMDFPKNRTYMPPMNIIITDNRHFGRKPIVGVNVIKNLWKYKVVRSTKPTVTINLDNPPDSLSDTIIQMEPETRRKLIIEDDIDWWSKYYFSLNEVEKCKTYAQKNYEKLKVYDKELENQKEFEYLTDFCETFELKRGKSLKEDNDFVGFFKGAFKIYPISKTESLDDIRSSMAFKNVQPLTNQEFLLRIYIIKCINLQPKDLNGKCDPYIEISVGKQKIDNRDDYIPNSINPLFGKMFEMKVCLPNEKDLTIKVKDYDLITFDDTVGETKIDLENRFISKYRATCGLPKHYNISGSNVWRDSRKPSQILSDICKSRNIPFTMPNPGASSLTLDGNTISLQTYEKEDEVRNNPHLGPKHERLCLYALQGFNLVPEHVETRRLYNAVQPDIEQGRILMWIDMFPTSLGLPGPSFDISPRKPKKYFLRCIIWNTAEVPLDDTTPVLGSKSSDIFVKGWLDGLENDKQKTDVHFNSYNGDGKFNWRFIYEFDYLVAEQNIVTKRKQHFWSLDETETKMPPVLNIQIWDNDKFSPDDFLSETSLNLNMLIKPVKTADKCGLHQIVDDKKPSINKTSEFLSLFELKRIKGWWPCRKKQTDNTYGLAGKIEMELEILTEEEAIKSPAGRGRDKPNSNPRLEEPKRLNTSFFDFSKILNKIKSMNWRNIIIGAIVGFIILLILFYIFVTVYTLPAAIWSNVVFKQDSIEIKNLNYNKSYLLSS